MFKRISILTIAVIFLLFTTNAFAGVIELPKTGQTKCYDSAGTEITCAGTGQDGEIRAGVFVLIFLLTTTGDSWLTNINQSERLIKPESCVKQHNFTFLDSRLLTAGMTTK